MRKSSSQQANAENNGKGNEENRPGDQGEVGIRAGRGERLGFVEDEENESEGEEGLEEVRKEK